MELRQLGQTEIRVSPVALGCWPIAGMTSSGVTDADSLATIAACFDLGINFLDTAYGYGTEGESERLIARALGNRRDEMVIATKAGIHWGPGRRQILDASPARLRTECEESLRRLQTDRVELLYLHAPDATTPIAESAGELKRLQEEGKARAIGASNLNLVQLEAFAQACPLAAFQPAYNMLERQIEQDTLPWCVEHGVSVVVYWPLLKGLLAAKIARDHQFPTTDSRSRYPMFQGDEWRKNHNFVDRLRAIATDAGKTVAELVINWTIHQPGITAALCGAKRPDQIRDNAGGMGWKLSAAQLAQIDAALLARGPAATKSPV